MSFQFDDEMASDSLLSESDRREMIQDEVILAGDYENPDLDVFLYDEEYDEFLDTIEDSDQKHWDDWDEDELEMVYLDAEEISPPYLIHTDM